MVESAKRKTIYAHHAMPGEKKGIYQVAPNKTSSSGNEDVHKVFLTRHAVFRAPDEQIASAGQPNHVNALHDVVGAAVHPEV